jgi:2-methylcitrate dehydratase PrpD
MKGRTLLEATVLAVEVMCRIGMAAGPGHYKGGWHITATCGVFGAATAASLVRGASSRQLADALGIAAGQGAMLLTNLAEMAKFVGVGNAARNGCLAAQYAHNGMTASRDALEGRFGFFEVMGMGEPRLSAFDGLGTPWEINRNMHKPYPVGVVLNSVITACLRLRETPGFSVGQIRQIRVAGHPLLVDRTDRASVRSIADARLSTQHTAAVTLLRGEPGLECFVPEAFENAEVRELARTVSVTAREGIEVSGVELTIIRDGGEPICIAVDDAKGSLNNPMSDDELVKKTIRLCQHGAPGFDPSPVIDAIWALEKTDDAGSILGGWRAARR